ncbi:MAG: CBS domain-containing protein [Nitrospirae bacterium]|nr:CBS domain-containing protein [Nitrospirota bacterium]MBU6480975.1 CBS domain-containing protein [Nitrospirota bacterium]MDE3041285.1 CBS domain-containing protein [Nitrospirota bacterium]
MNVQDIMTSDVQCCGPDTNLAAAAKMMWDSDCGALPVLNVQGQVMGMITDRDICMASATKNKPASDLTVWETVSGKAYSCRMSDDVHTALDIMKREKVRRLPVVDDDGVLQGVIAMNDFVLLAGEAKGGKAPAVSYEDVVRTMKAISAHRALVEI